MTERAIHAVIFDFDGLLVDSEPLQFAAWEAYLEQFDVQLPDELLARMYGARLVDSAKLVAEELALPVTAAEVMRGRDDIFLAMVPGRVRAKPGAHRLVAALKPQGVSVALATSGHRRYIDLALASAGLDRSFDVEVTGDMVHRGKPHPETFLTAAGLLNVVPVNCLVLEDSPQGVRAARAAGMTCFAVPDGIARDADLSPADKILSSLDEVIEAARDYGLAFSSESHG